MPALPWVWYGITHGDYSIVVDVCDSLSRQRLLLEWACCARLIDADKAHFITRPYPVTVSNAQYQWHKPLWQYQKSHRLRQSAIVKLRNMPTVWHCSRRANDPAEPTLALPCPLLELLRWLVRGAPHELLWLVCRTSGDIILDMTDKSSETVPSLPT